MSRKKAKLKITLKSDLCVGSGYSYAGIIDSDVCFNENGIPYIPARRIKGCLRESAELIGIDTDAVFGRSGNNSMCGFCIGNAYPEGYEEINEEINVLKNSGYNDIIDMQKVLETFTYIKTQTAIDKETGSSKENSLRYTRVINRYNSNKKELCFLADIEFDCDTLIVENAAKALRHIGMNRKRGLGNVRCTVYNIEECKDVVIEDFDDKEDIVTYYYVVNNIKPLIMSGKTNDKSENYISGKSIIGALAAIYTAQGKDTNSDEFYDLFINGNVKYSNLYITDKEYEGKNENGEDKYIYRKYAPAPLFINRLKKTKKIVNITKDYGINGEEYDSNGGNQPKKLKNKFICFADKKISVKEPLTNIVYHHNSKNGYSHNSGRENGINGNLYTLEVIKENQYFSGTITGKRKYVDLIFKLLEKNKLRVGKSKSAQYGECVVVEKHNYDCDFDNNFEVDKRVVVSFESDAVFQNENGFTVRSEDVKKLTADYLGIKYKKDAVCQMFLQTDTITGYNTMWNLKRPSISCIAAGSAIIYEISENCNIKSEYVGVMNTEGFGKIKIYKFDNLIDKYLEYSGEKKKLKPDKCWNIMEEILFKNFENAVKEGSMLTGKIDISASTIGRVTLMLDESMKNYKDDYKKAFEDFKKRIDSLKRKDEKRKIGIFLSEYICENKEFSIVKDIDLKELNIDIDKIIGTENSASRSIYNKIKELGIIDAEEKIKGLWGKYLKSILIFQKYEKKEG